MAITAKQVSELRKMTGSPMMDCKKVLTEAEGDMDKAVQLLRERGQAKAAKRVGNETTEGIVFCKVNDDNSSASIVKLTCETEPVTNTDQFIAFGDKISEMVFNGKSEELKNDTFAESLTEIRASLGENITLQESAFLSGDLVSIYVHSNKKVGVLVELGLSDKSKSADDKLIELAKNLTLQIASLNPKSISIDELDPEFVAGEIEIIKNHLKEDPKNKNKPENILDMIVEGRKGKIFAEHCLLEQEYVKEKMFIKELVANVEKEVGTDISVKKFVRYSIG